MDTSAATVHPQDVVESKVIFPSLPKSTCPTQLPTASHSVLTAATPATNTHTTTCTHLSLYTPSEYTPATGQPHLDSMSCRISSCHVVDGVPAPNNFHPIRMNSGNDMVMGSSTDDVPPVVPPGSAVSSMSDMAVSPPSVASTGHFPFTVSEISGMGVDTSALDTAFTSDVASSVGLQLPPDTGAAEELGDEDGSVSLSLRGLNALKRLSEYAILIATFSKNSTSTATHPQRFTWPCTRRGKMS